MVKNGFLKLRLDLGLLQVELVGNDAPKCLQELNKALDRINRITEGSFDMADYRLSDEIIFNHHVMKEINKLSQIYSGYKINRIAIENKRIVELEKGKVNTQLDLSEVKKNISKLLYPVNGKDVKQVLVHIKGAVKNEEAQKIVDVIELELKGAEVRTIFSKGEVASHTIVECVFFGEFEDNL